MPADADIQDNDIEIIRDPVLKELIYKFDEVSGKHDKDIIRTLKSGNLFAQFWSKDTCPTPMVTPQ